MQKKTQEELRVWLKKKNFQKRINALAKKYKDKKVLIYGAGILSSIIFEEYDLSNLNVIGISDKRFYSNEEDFKGFKTVPPFEINDYEADVVLIATYNTYDVKEFLEDSIDLDSSKCTLEPIVKKNIIEKIQELIDDLTS